MFKTSQLVRYGLMMLLVLILGVLLGFYIYLQSKRTSQATIDTARGIAQEAPVYGGTLGSTYDNTNAAVTSDAGAQSADNTTSSSVATGARLISLHKTPVAGFGFVSVGSSTKIVFVERATGYVFAVDPQTGDTERLTNTLLPKTYTAFIARNGSVLLQHLGEGGDIQTLAGTIPGNATTSQTLLTTPLAPNMYAVATDYANASFVFLTHNGSHSSITSSSWDGSKQKELYSSVIGGWRPIILGDGRTFLLENPADTIAGYAYELKNGGLDPLVRNVPGLTVLPQSSSTAFLYSSSDEAGLTLYSQQNKSTDPTALPVQTITDKCAWVPVKSGKTASSTKIAYCAVPRDTPPPNFLSAWYRGEAHTHDAWWRVDAGAGTAEQFFVGEGALGELDARSLAIDPSGTTLVFINNADLSLWMLRLAH